MLMHLKQRELLNKIDVYCYIFKMGSQQCSSCKEEQHFSPGYGFFERIEKQGITYALISRTISKDVIQIEHLKQQLTKRKSLSSLNLTKMHEYSILTDQYFFTVEVKYEYLPLTLAEKMRGWRTNNRLVPQPEIASLLLGVEKGLNELSLADIRHRCINLNTIVCLKAVYKLVDSSMLTFLTGLDLARQGDMGQLLSPRMLEILNHQGSDPHYQKQDDLYSLGLLAIILALRIHPEQLYLKDRHTRWVYNLKLIQQGLSILQGNYDAWISKSVRRLLYGNLKQSNSTCNWQTTVKKSVYY